LDTAFSEARLCADVNRLRAIALVVPATSIWTSSAFSCNRPGRFSKSFLCLLFLLVALLTPTAFADIQYVYDENGRLVQVVDPTGTSAQYSYDAAGNITAINQVSASTVSITEFTANAGPVGTTVTIYGTGFSTTPSSNIVKFNGTTATVSSSTATQLTVTVPLGATTGKITVLVGSTTATSAQDFTVSSGIPVPTISAFSPTIGTAGTAVTLNGANFDTNLANDKLRFNGTTASTISAVATQISSKVPVFATSGRVSIDTPYGRAISTGDFFVPPAPYTVADVGFMGRTTVGAPPASVSLAATTKVAMLLFDGVKGQQLGLGVSNVVFSPSSSGSVYVKKPNGEDLTSGGMYFNSGGAGMSLPTLPTTGTYTILIVTNSASNLSLAVSLSQDVTGTIVAGGSPVPVATTFVGQKVNLAFAGTQGQRISLRISGVTLTGGISMGVSILKPDGTTLVVDTWVSGADFIDVQSLPVNGTYAILVDPAYAALVTATLTLYDVPPDTTGTITAGGASVPVTTTVPGQSANLTFAGTQGQRISLAVTGVALTGGTSNIGSVFILKPDGTTLVTDTWVSGADFIDAQSLPATGTYTIRFHPLNGSAGSGTFTLYDVPPDTTGTITAGGASVPVATTVPGQNANLTFAGTQGQRISLAVTGVTLTGGTFNYASVLILKPDGTTLASISPVSSSGFIDLQTLPTTGTYTARFDPANTSVGSGTLTLYDVPPDATGTVTIGGPAVALTTTVPGQNAVFSFDGTEGQQVTGHVTGNTMPGYTYVYLRKPDNSTLTWTGSYSASFNVPTATLPTTGTYTILVNSSGTATGSVSVNVTSP
jgi:YD repeat-containing protein